MDNSLYPERTQSTQKQVNSDLVSDNLDFFGNARLISVVRVFS